MGISACNVITGPKGQERPQGTSLFPASCYADDLNATPEPWHWHDELECFLVTEGTAEVLLEKEHLFLPAGEGMLLPGGLLHAMPQAMARLHSVVFHSRLIGGEESVFRRREVLPLRQWVRLAPEMPREREALECMAEAWQAMAREPDDWENFVRWKLTHMLHLLAGTLPPAPLDLPKKESEETERLKTMLQYIGDHYAEAVSLSQIASSAALSESSCLRCFRKGIGTTPGQVLRQIRIEKAAEMLLRSDASSGEIGAACGFADESYFIRTFRSLHGTTPGEYRAAQKEKAACMPDEKFES